MRRLQEVSSETNNGKETSSRVLGSSASVCDDARRLARVHASSARGGASCAGSAVGVRSRGRDGRLARDRDHHSVRNDDSSCGSRGS